MTYEAVNVLTKIEHLIVGGDFHGPDNSFTERYKKPRSTHLFSLSHLTDTSDSTILSNTDIS